MKNLKVQAYLEDIAAWVPDCCNKSSIAIKQVAMFLLVEGLKQKCKKVGGGVPIQIEA